MSRRWNELTNIDISTMRSILFEDLGKCNGRRRWARAAGAILSEALPADFEQGVDSGLAGIYGG